MTKIQRTTQKIFGSNAPADDIAVMGSFKTGTPIYTDSVQTLQNEAFEQGYSASLVANEAPFLEEQNSIPYILSKQLAYLFQEGISEYDAGTTYYIGSIVKNLEENKVVLYQSTTDNNTGNPLTDIDNWEKVELGGGGSGTGGNNLFDLITVDHILEGDGAVGKGLLGTYVYKTGVSGARNGYPDFYNKCVAEFDNSVPDTVALKDNIIEVGRLWSKNGILNGFTASAYAYPNTSQTFAQAANAGANWEVVFSFKLNTLGQAQYILGGNGNTYTPDISISADNKFGISLSSNGSSYNIAQTTGSFVLSANTDYLVKLEFTGTKYILSYSTDGENFTPDITVTSSTKIESTADISYIGCRGNLGGPLQGTIDLKGSYININGQRWWTGADVFNFYKNANGHAFYDIADKATVDEIYEKTGVAWYYGIDKENERIFLPRNDNFSQVPPKSGYWQPDYSERLLRSNATDHTATRDGWLMGYDTHNRDGANNDRYVYINGENMRFTNVSADYYVNSFAYPVVKGDTYRFENIEASYFIPCKSTEIDYSSNNYITPQYVYMVVGNTQEITHVTTTIPEGEALEQIYKNKADITNLKDAPHIVDVSDPSLMPSWYRVWSDGRLEQGGIVTRTTNVGAGTLWSEIVTLLKEFDALTYGGSVIPFQDTDVTGGGYETSFVRLSTNKVQLRCYNRNGSTQMVAPISLSWSMTGYIKKGDTNGL